MQETQCSVLTLSPAAAAFEAMSCLCLKQMAAAGAVGMSARSLETQIATAVAPGTSAPCCAVLSAAAVVARFSPRQNKLPADAVAAGEEKSFHSHSEQFETAAAVVEGISSHPREQHYLCYQPPHSNPRSGWISTAVRLGSHEACLRSGRLFRRFPASRG